MRHRRSINQIQRSDCLIFFYWPLKSRIPRLACSPLLPAGWGWRGASSPGSAPPTPPAQGNPQWRCTTGPWLGIISFLPAGLFTFLFLVPRIKEGPLSVPGFSLHMYIRVFGKMPRFEPELLRRKPGVLPMSYTHPFLSTSLPGRSFSGLVGGSTSDLKKKRQWSLIRTRRNLNNQDLDVKLNKTKISTNMHYGIS